VRFSVTAKIGFPTGLELDGLNVEEHFSVFIEIKPTMGDDYPAVLRQIKRQQQQQQHERDCYSRELWFLLVDQFCSQAVLLDQVREIFAADEIGIVMMHDVREYLIGRQNDVSA
jgi:hypothetical protein